MAILIGLAIGLVVAGLIICRFSESAGRAKNFFWWLGIILATVGAILLISPVIVWLDGNLRQMLGAH